MDQDTDITPEAQTTSLKPHRGVMVLVLGILSIACCLIFGIIAWVMGNADLAEMDAGTMDPEGRSLTQAGKICGIVGIILNVIGFILGLLLVVLSIIGTAVAS